MVILQARQLLQGTTPQQQILTQVLCFADQAAASAEQFTGLTGGKTGLPSVLNNLVGTSNSIESTLEYDHLFSLFPQSNLFKLEQ